MHTPVLYSQIWEIHFKILLYRRRLSSNELKKSANRLFKDNSKYFVFLLMYTRWEPQHLRNYRYLGAKLSMFQRPAISSDKFLNKGLNISDLLNLLNSLFTWHNNFSPLIDDLLSSTDETRLYVHDCPDCLPR